MEWGKASTNMGYLYRKNTTSIPTIHVISDSVGATAQAVARAAASQFGETAPNIELVSNVRSFDEVSSYLDDHLKRHQEVLGDDHIVVFYTLVDAEIRAQLQTYLSHHPQITATDLLSDAIDAIAHVSGKKPLKIPGEMHVTDANYFRRIEAVEFTIAHDDGRNPQDLSKADIVLLGVSRSSKTPTSIYLSQQGYRVANVPLDLRTDPPAELFEVDPTRMFGLMTTADVLVTIRRRRLGRALAVAGDYANPESVEKDLEKARALMRKLRCIVVHTDNRAVEETAQEILRYYDLAHPESSKVDSFIEN
jgi:regulator of PEP synthase PpsR (kinase-PPPase family)